MNKRSANTLLALTLAVLTVAPGAALAACHGTAGHGHGAAGAQSAAEQKQIYTATGVVKSIDGAALKAVITHDPVPALGWPAMTMGFVFEDNVLPNDLKAGDKVRFDFRNQDNGSVIVDIETRQ